MSASSYAKFKCDQCGCRDTTNGMGAAAHRRSKQHMDALRQRLSGGLLSQGSRVSLEQQIARAERDNKRFAERRLKRAQEG